MILFLFNCFSIYFAGALPFVTASVFCLGGFLKWLTIISYIILCLLCLQKALTAGSPWQRRLCFALPFLMRVLLTILRISRFGGGNPKAMVHVFLQVSFKINFCLRSSIYDASSKIRQFRRQSRQLESHSNLFKNYTQNLNFKYLRDISRAEVFEYMNFW